MPGPACATRGQLTAEASKELEQLHPDTSQRCCEGGKEGQETGARRKEEAGDCKGCEC